MKKVLDSKSSKELTFEATESRKTSEKEQKSRNKKADKSSANYANPPIPEGFEYVSGTWDTGFVIREIVISKPGYWANLRRPLTLVWVPVGALPTNATRDGKTFNKRFGIRNYSSSHLAQPYGVDPINEEAFQNQIESVKKYGGFYIFCYTISVNSVVESVKGEVPSLGRNYEEAKRIAASLINTESLKTHLLYGAEYDSALEWFIQSKVRSYAEIAKDSSNWGNYRDTICVDNYIYFTTAPAVSGSRQEYYTNNIADIAGNTAEWTQEIAGNGCRMVRGGSSKDFGCLSPAAYREKADIDYRGSDVSFRAALYIK